MSHELPESEPTRRGWAGFWCTLFQQAAIGFNDKVAQFAILALGGASAFTLLVPGGDGVAMNSCATTILMMAVPMILFAPLAGWVSDRFSKRDVMIAASVTQATLLGGICGVLMMKSTPLALWGFFALATLATFFSPAKFGINKELVGSKHLGLAAGIQQMSAVLAVLGSQLFTGWWIQHGPNGSGTRETSPQAAVVPMLLTIALSVPALAVAWAVPRVPSQGGPKFTAGLFVSHRAIFAGLWRDMQLRRASLGVAFFWGFAAYIYLWAIKLAAVASAGGGVPGWRSSGLMTEVPLGLAAGFGCSALLLHKRIELGWAAVGAMAMTVSAALLAFLPAGGWGFRVNLGLLAFSGAVFSAPLASWMQDHYPAAQRGALQSAVNAQNCVVVICAVIASGFFELGVKAWGIPASVGLRIEMILVSTACGLVSLLVLRLLPGHFIRLIGGAIIRSVYRIQVLNQGRIPAKGGALLLPNHVSFADGLFISASSPRPVRFVMDEVFMSRRSIRIFVSIFETVTIRRDQPREAIRITIDALKKGDLVCLFPEGQLTRTGTLNELRRGFELIAKKAGHPLIPMWCDGAWGSIFSFERGRFFRKWPRRSRSGMTVAFGSAIRSENADLDTVRQSLLETSAEAVAKSFESPDWETLIPRGKCAAIRNFRSLSGPLRRRGWVNGHQIGQINALQRRYSFFSLDRDPTVAGLPGIALTFPELFEAKWKTLDAVNGNQPASWVGGDRLRSEFGHTQLSEQIVFYDFGPRALEPIFRAGLHHCPCLAVDGIVIAMSMPNPPKAPSDEEGQIGHKLGTWGKLLPGWFLLPSPNGGLRAHGPAASEDGLALPPKCFLDAQGFLTRGK